MYLKQFRTVSVRVPDPLRPGRRTFEDRLIPTGCHSVSHEGVTYSADEDDWFEFPPEVGTELLKYRHPGGEKFYSPADVDEQVRLGALDEDGPDLTVQRTEPRRPSRRGRKPKAPEAPKAAEDEDDEDEDERIIDPGE